MPGCEKRQFESRFVDVSDEFLNEVLDNSIPKTRCKDSLIGYQP
jgi:hypothetical protein